MHVPRYKYCQCGARLMNIAISCNEQMNNIIDVRVFAWEFLLRCVFFLIVMYVFLIIIMKQSKYIETHLTLNLIHWNGCYCLSWCCCYCYYFLSPVAQFPLKPFLFDRCLLCNITIRHLWVQIHHLYYKSIRLRLKVFRIHSQWSIFTY